MSSNPVEFFNEIYEKRHNVAPLFEDDISAINPSSLDEPGLSLICEYIRKRNVRRILELGSGVSTRVFSRLLGAVEGSAILSVDHSSHFFQKTRAELAAPEIVELKLAPLKVCWLARRFYTTYDTRVFRRNAAGRKFDLVIIDGPPGYNVGRTAALYAVLPYINENTLVLLDDSLREPERQAIREWSDVLPGFEYRDFDIKKGLTAIRLSERTIRRGWHPRRIAGSLKLALKAIEKQRQEDLRIQASL